MLTDREIQALFADNSESDSPKKSSPKSKLKTDKKTRPPKKKAKITFDPDIFLDDAIKEQNEPDIMTDSPLDFFSKNENTSIPPEFSNLIGRITFYLNSQLRYLMDDFANELILLVDTSPKEREMVDNFLNEVCESIKNSFYLYEDDSNNISTFFTPDSFDVYSDRFYQIFLKCEEYSKISYDTLQIKSLRKDVNNSYNRIKKNLQTLPESFEREINELSMSYNNYYNNLNNRQVQERSQKSREISLNCKRIEQKILYDLYSKQIEFIKDEQSKYSQFLEKNEYNSSITADKISDAISSLKENIVFERKSSSEKLYEREKTIQKLKDELKMLRGQYQYLQQNQISVAFSSIKDESNNSQFQSTFINNSALPMNNSSISMQQDHPDSVHKSRINSKNSNDSFSKIQKTFNSLLKEQNKNLENTSDFIESLKDEKMVRMMRRSYYG